VAPIGVRAERGERDDVRIVNDYPDDPKAGEAHQDLGNQPDARDPRKEP
jgi:hypothetical protein